MTLTSEDWARIMEEIKKARIPPMKIFGLNASRAYAEKVAMHLGMSLTPHEEKLHDDGECFLRSDDEPEGNVRGHTVFVIQSVYTDDEESVADKFMKLCIMCGSLKSASAHEVIPVVPHLGWCRQDRKTGSRAPVSTKIIAKMMQATGIARAVFMDVHNISAEQNAFDIPIDILEAKKLHAQWCADKLKDADKIAVMSPDKGGLTRATSFRNCLAKVMGRKQSDIGVVIFDKHRDPKSGELSGAMGGLIVGDVDGAEVIAVDDLISTAGTVDLACSAVPKSGGHVAAVCATHGLFVGDANKHLECIDAPIVVADTVDPLFRLTPANKAKIHFIDTSAMVADAIGRIHRQTGSISELLS